MILGGATFYFPVLVLVSPCLVLILLFSLPPVTGNYEWLEFDSFDMTWTRTYINSKLLEGRCSWLQPSLMDEPSAWYQACICGRMFSVPQAYSCHSLSCLKTKKRLSLPLGKAKKVWQEMKHRRRESEPGRAVSCSSNQNCGRTVKLHSNPDPCPRIPPQVRVWLLHHSLSL